MKIIMNAGGNMIYVILYLVLVFLIMNWAGKWNRSRLGFGLLALVFSPLLSAIVLLVMGRK